MSGKRKVIVIGGSNVDITGTPDTELVSGDSNPGGVSISAGGVGRNIAENAARLGLPVSLISAVGDDYFGGYLKSVCRQAGIDTENIITDNSRSTSAYLCIMDGRDDLAAAVSDMKITETLSPELISSMKPLISGAAIVIIDNNIRPAAIEAVKAAGANRILFDAVSGKKLRRSIDAVCDIDTVKLNAIEAEILSGVPVNSTTDAERAADIIRKRNIEHVFITLGAAGAFYSCRQGNWTAAPYPLAVKNITGAGDAFLAGIAYGHYNGTSGQDLLNIGTACAAAAAASEKTVSDKINPELIKQIITGGMNELQ